MADYAALDDEALLRLLRTEEDRLPRAAVDALLARLPRVKDALAAILTDDDLWDTEKGDWWALVHATYILAAGADPDSIEPLIAALQRSLSEDDLDWIYDPSAAFFLKFGAPAARRLIEHLENEAEDDDWGFFLSAAAAVAHPDDELSRALLRVAAHKARDLDFDDIGDGYVLDTFVNYVLAGKRALVDEALSELSPKKRRQAEAYLLKSAKGLEEFPDYSPFHDSKRDFLKFYDAAEIRKRQERWAKEAAEPDDDPFDDDEDPDDELDPDFPPAPPPLRLVPKVGRNDPCPCGSGKKFKKCCEGKASAAPQPLPRVSIPGHVDTGMRDIRALLESGQVKTTADLNRLIVGKTPAEIRALAKKGQPPPGPAPRAAHPEPAGTGHFDIEVSVRSIAPRIWRRFLIADTETFLDLHEAIQDAGGWSDDHMFAFRTPDGRTPVAGLPDDEDGGDLAAELLLRDVLAPDTPADLLYEYDFGDAWRLDVRCHGLVRNAGDFQRRFTGGARAFPAEDCGGLRGYENCVEACAATQPNREQKERLEWLGKWRPEAFDAAKLSKKFDRAKRRRHD